MLGYIEFALKEDIFKNILQTTSSSTGSLVI